MQAQPADDAPLVLTARLDDATFARLDRLRQAHFPPALNVLPAHLTLFHHLPGARLGDILADLGAAARGRGRLPLTLAGVQLLGRGVAVKVEVPGLAALRGQLARAWEGWLTAQDRQGLRPHVTVQNKVTSEAARALHARLLAGFAPATGAVVGLDLWHYRGGPWEPAGSVDLAGDGPAEPS